MRYYFAPMEGLTDSVYRRLHHTYFGSVDAYFMPFLSPTMHRTLTDREARELPYADSVPFRAVPQLLTKVPGDFLWACEVCKDRGYDEVNLNLGCPSGTVVAKGKGSGMLREPETLDAFLEAVFAASPIPISVKTRLGLESAEEFPRLLEIFNRYPIKELTVHPRVRRQFYAGDVDSAAFSYALEHSRNPLCCNGDIRSKAQADSCSTDAVMIGRGLIGDPGMLLPGGTQAEVLAAFLSELLETYCTSFGGSRNAMFRLKEHWGMLLPLFQGSEKLGKRLRKTTDLAEFKDITSQILQLPILK